MSKDFEPEFTEEQLRRLAILQLIGHPVELPYTWKRRLIAEIKKTWKDE